MSIETWMGRERDLFIEEGNRARVTKAARFTGRTAFLNPRLCLSGGQSEETETIRTDSVKDHDFNKAFRFDKDEDQKPHCICHSVPRVLCPQTQRRRLQFNMASSNTRLSVPLASRRHKGQHSQVPCPRTYRTQRRRLQFNMASSHIRLSVPLASRRHKGQCSQVPCPRTYRTKRLQFKRVKKCSSLPLAGIKCRWMMPRRRPQFSVATLSKTLDLLYRY